MTKIRFEPTDEGGLESARTIVLERLRIDKEWKYMEYAGEGFDKLVEYVGNPSTARQELVFLSYEIMWELIIQRVIAPGMNYSNPNLPWFHITRYGEKVLAGGDYLPHDPAEYLKRFHEHVKEPDNVLLAYLSESINSYVSGNIIAAALLLGIASERAFLTLCERLLGSLRDKKEREAFTAILSKNPMKPKMDWVANKIQDINGKCPRSLPDNINITLLGVFNLIRVQRNSLGHPQEKRPKVTRDDAYVLLRMFPTYVQTINSIIEYLDNNKV